MENNMLNKEKIFNVLSQIYVPELHRSLTDLNMVRDVHINMDHVEVIIALTMPDCPHQAQIKSDVHTAIATLPEVNQVSVKFTSMTDEERKTLFGKTEEGSAVPYNHIQRVVAVMSGKGGVGKSLVTGLLASALAQAGYQVGILDADITGPSIPMLFGLRGPVEPGPVGIRPLQSLSGIKVISMNFLLESEDRPIIWRGPLIGRAINQLWGEVMWGDLDYLLVDLPPGTSDASLTTMQSLPVNGIVMVTTPQNLASMIVRKAVHMAQTLKTPIVGVVENMAYFICPDTGKPHFIFGPSHADAVVKTAGAPLLAQLPLDPQVAALCDAGEIESVQLEEMPALLEAFTQISNMRVNRHRSGQASFSAQARQLIESRESMGSIENPDARGFVRGPCGDSMQIDLRLDGDVIQETRYTTDGCKATIACGGMLSRLVQGKTRARAQEISADDLITALEGLPAGHEHCAQLAVNTLQQALKNALVNQLTFYQETK
jgi:Mrp family chromosome partitioning ATPase/NifU-like protein involved in Fe-S cluster formation